MLTAKKLGIEGITADYLSETPPTFYGFTYKQILALQEKNSQLKKENEELTDFIETTMQQFMENNVD